MTITRMTADLMTAQQIYEAFWKPIVEILPQGVLDRRKIMNELADYYVFMEHCARVYDHVTGGKISKINTKSDAVIAVADDHLSDLVDEAVKEELERYADKCTCGAFHN